MAKATKKQALGRGLSALLKDPDNDINSAEDTNADKVVGNIVELDLDSIKVNPFQPRTNFNEESLRAIAHYSLLANEKTEDIGARRLHTVMEKILEEISFSADEHHGETINVDKTLVEEKISKVVEDEDATRYIL